MNFVEKCEHVSDYLGIEIIDVYDDGGSPSEFEDDGMLHVIEGNTRVVFDVSYNQSLSREKQNANTIAVMDELGRKLTGSVLV